jgi:hypothetical protein
MPMTTPAPFHILDTLRSGSSWERSGKNAKELLTGVHDNIQPKMRRHVLEVEKIEADPHLSADGKRDKIKQHAMKFAEEYQSVPRVLKRETEAKQALEQRLFALPARREGLEGLADRMDDAEIRAAFATKSRAERDAAYAAALQSGNVAVQRALTQTPLGSLIDPEFQQRALTEHVEKTRPAEMAKLKEQEEVVEHLTVLQQTLKGWLENLGADSKALEL